MPKATAPARVDSQGGRATSDRSRSPPVVAQGIAYTHFVTPNGSTSSFCTQREPCSLPRAVSLVGTSNMPPGSTVLVQRGADGIYSQGPLAFDGNGRADEPIKFIGQDGVRITGTRFEPPAAQWTRVADRQFTYQIDWDEEANFIANNAAQRPPVSTWRPIRVDDRLPPFTQSQGRPFNLEFPIRFTGRSSIDQVEAHHCTIWNDRANNKVYVHMCHDGPPRDADNLYLASNRLGHGRHQRRLPVAREHRDRTGRRHRPAGEHVGEWHGAAADRGARVKVWLEGTNTLAEDLDVGHVISQGLHPNQCYDANPDFGAGECWNAAGNGRALLVGRERRTTSFGQIVRRAKIHRSWNGARVDGRNTLEQSILWGFPNHTLEASGTGGVFRHNVFLNGQDSIFLGTNPFDDLTVEHNIIVNSAYFTVSNHGTGGTTPKVGWRFRYNILSGIVFDEKTFSTVESDCNVYIAGAATLMRVVGGGGTASTYDTLEQVRSRTPLEQRSVILPRSAWTDGTLFRHYVGQTSTEFDFTPVNAEALELCGRRVGPNTTSRTVARQEVTPRSSGERSSVRRS